MRNAMTCTDCHIYMKVDTIGISILETAGASREPYKLYMADLMVCESCGKQVAARFGIVAISEHWMDNFKQLLADAEKSGKLFYADERAGRKAKS